MTGPMSNGALRPIGSDELLLTEAPLLQHLHLCPRAQNPLTPHSPFLRALPPCGPFGVAHRLSAIHLILPRAKSASSHLQQHHGCALTDAEVSFVTVQLLCPRTGNKWKEAVFLFFTYKYRVRVWTIRPAVPREGQIKTLYLPRNAEKHQNRQGRVHTESLFYKEFNSFCCTYSPFFPLFFL